MGTKFIPYDLGENDFLWALDQNFTLKKVEDLVAKLTKHFWRKQGSLESRQSSAKDEVFTLNCEVQTVFSQLQGRNNNILLMNGGSEIASNIETQLETVNGFVTNYKPYYIPWIEKIISPTDRILDIYSKNYK